MDLRQLEYVVAVARRLSFTAAAGELHLAQPALSKSIANLEAELGTQLFERNSRRVSLTDAGVTFVARARRILADVNNLGTEMRAFSDGTLGSVRISTWFHTEPLLPTLLHDFIEQNPGIQVSVVELPAAEMVSALREDEIDLAVSVVPPDFEAAEISYEVIRHERLVLVMRADDALAKRRSIPIALIGGRALIAPLPGTALRVWFDRTLDQAGAEPRIVVETNELAAALAYVSVGLGMVILPSSVAPPVEPPLVMARLVGAPEAGVVLAWHDTTYRTPAAARALAFAQARVPEVRRRLAPADGQR